MATPPASDEQTDGPDNGSEAAVPAASPAGRVPAEPIEQMVLAQIHAALMSPEMVQSVWDVAREKYPTLTEPEVVLPLRQMGQVWMQLFPAERQRIVQLLIERVTLREEGIEITWRDTGWHALAGEMRPGTFGGELLELEQQESSVEVAA